MSNRKKIPISVSEHISNAKHYLEAADRFPAPTNYAVQILLLLIAWENIATANEELAAWAKAKDVDMSIYKSHAKKFSKPPEIHRNDTNIFRVKNKHGSIKSAYKDGKDFEKLRQLTQYGSQSETFDIRLIFKAGWHTDNFRNRLIGFIDLVESIHKIYSSNE